MNSYIIFWGTLVLLCALSIFIMGSFTEGFEGITYIPESYMRWGGGPPPWRGWRHRWGWGWPLWGWGRYGWGGSWGYDPRKYYVTYTEPFSSGTGEQPESLAPEETKEDTLISFPPNGPAPLQKTSQEPYQLLNDEFPSVGPPDQISNVNSRSCFATDFSRLLESSSYRQLTNNYKHGYPDSCSAPFQEMVLSFYKSNGMTIDVPKNCM